MFMYELHYSMHDLHYHCVVVPGSAVRLPYHQPEKKDLSVFLARTELKQQKFVGASRMSWKQFVPPASSLTKADSILTISGAISSEKVRSALPTESTVAGGDVGMVGKGMSESDELPDLLSFCSKLKTVPADILASCAETLTQVPTSSKSSPQKRLLLSPVRNTPATSEPSTLSDSCVPVHSENDTQQVETSLAPAVGKKLILDAADETSGQLESVGTEAEASDAVEVDSKMSFVTDCMAVDQQHGDDEVGKIPSSSAVKISSRSSHRILPSDVPLPQLSGNPNDIIEFDDNDNYDGDSQQGIANDQGVERLMERLLQHARGPTQTRKPKTVEIR